MITARIELGSCLTSLGYFEEAETVLLDAQAAAAQASDETQEGALTSTIAERLDALRTAWGEPADAARSHDYGTDGTAGPDR